MAYVAPTTRADGYTIPASEWNQEVVENPIALHTIVTGGNAGQVLTSAGGGADPTWASAGNAADSDQAILGMQVFS